MLYEKLYRYIAACLFMVSLFFLPSCIKYHKLVESETHQGKDLTDNRAIAHRYVRSITIYDQFETKARFDALWLSDEVRMAYVERYCQRRGKSDEEADAILARQLEENKHSVSFYVLADIREKRNEMLSEKEPIWTMYLDCDGRRASPENIKEIELEPEYQFFFGYRMESFKTAYLVKFPMRVVGTDVLWQEGAVVQLYFSSPTKTSSVRWNPEENRRFFGSLGEKSEKKWKKAQNGKELKDEDFYWG